MPAKSNTNWALLAAALALTAAIGTMVWSNASGAQPTTTSAPRPPAATAAIEPAASTAPMHFDTTTMTIKGHTFSMEVAQSTEQQERGLMYRKSMAADHGMLFAMDGVQVPTADDPRGFWMHNTWIPLDIIFLDQHGTVITVQPRAPLDERGMGPGVPYLYVLELNQGTADKIGLKPGDTVEIPKPYAKN